MPLTRRSLFSRLAFGLTFIPTIASAPRSVLSSLLFEPEGRAVPAKPVPSNPFQRNDKALVALVHGEEIDRILLEGLALIGGLERLQLKGKRVLIKPNVVNDRPPPTTTNPLLVAAVVRLVREAGATEIIVAESSGIIRFPTSANLEATGIKRAAEAEGARVLALDDQPWVRVEPRAAKAIPRYYVSQPVYDADVFISLPVIKTHKFAHYSCSLKNLVGIIHPRYRPSVTFLSSDWHERIVELNLAVHPHLTIADGTTVMIAGGPTSGQSARANVILLSGDRVALDVVALALLRSYGASNKIAGKRIWEERQIKRAVELSLGVKRASYMQLLAHSIAGGSQEFDTLVARIRRDIAV
jgi:uncharacterized protein (DUF362 family)